MAALTADFDSPIANQRALVAYAVTVTNLSTAPAYAGGLAQVDGSGGVQEAVSSITNVIVGQFVRGYNSNNSTATQLPVREGDILMNTQATITNSDIGKVVYAYDDNHVQTNSGGPKAGILIALETFNGVTMARVRCTLEANT